MSVYKTKFNPWTKKRQWIFDSSLLKVKGSVATYNDLPLSGNTENDSYFTQDTDKLYTWSISASSGILTDWVEVGTSATSITWDAIDGKPGSTPIDIDDAVSKKHEHSNKAQLDLITDGDHDVRTDNPHSVTKSQVGLSNVDNVSESTIISDVKSDSDVADAISKKHTQNSDTILDNGGSYEISSSEIVTNLANMAFLAIERAKDNVLGFYRILEGIVDGYINESGIDTINSVNKIHNSSGYYKPSGSVDANTLLLLHCNGIDGATTTEDDSIYSRTVSFFGNCQLDTAEKKFGDSSLLFDGNGDYITVPDSTDWNFTGDFTVDCQVKLASLGQYTYLAGNTDAFAGSPGWFFALTTAGNIQFDANYGDPSYFALSGSHGISDTNWHHVAVVRSGTTVTLYVDGISKASGTFSSALTNPSSDLYIGINADGSNYPMNGHIDEMRISSVARWTSNFTAPSSQYSEISDNMTLISEDFPLASQPNKYRTFIVNDEISPITINTDFICYVSRDAGVTYTQASLVDLGEYDTNKHIYMAIVDVSSQPSGSTFKYKIHTYNNKEIKVRGIYNVKK